MRRWIPVLLVVAATVASIIVYPQMPERIPTHWSMSGEVDGWSSRLSGAWLMPLMMAFILVVLRIVPHIDPRRANYEKFSGVYEVIVTLSMAFMLGIHLMVLAVATGSDIPVARIIPAAVGLLFFVLGFLLPRAHPNWFIGIRTPWTLTSDAVWEKTHKVGGILFAVAGALTVLAAIVVPRMATPVLIATASVAVISAFAYSFVAWRQEKESSAAL